MNYYAWKMRAPRSHCFSPHMNNRHLWQLKKSKSWGPFWSYQLNSSANPAHLPQKRAKWAELAVLFSWQLQNGTQGFDFFNCHWCRLFILCEIHCCLCPHIFWVYYFIFSQCVLWQNGKRLKKVRILLENWFHPFVSFKMLIKLSQRNIWKFWSESWNLAQCY